MTDTPSLQREPEESQASHIDRLMVRLFQSMSVEVDTDAIVYRELLAQRDLVRLIGREAEATPVYKQMKDALISFKSNLERDTPAGERLVIAWRWQALRIARAEDKVSTSAVVQMFMPLIASYLPSEGSNPEFTGKPGRSVLEQR